MTITNLPTMEDLDTADTTKWYYVESEKKIYYYTGSEWAYVDVYPIPLS